MRPTKVHTRIIQHPFADLMQGVRLDSFQSNRQDLILNIHGLHRISSVFFERDRKIFEKASCTQVPMNLRFSGVTKLRYSPFFSRLEDCPLDDPSRLIVGMYSWQQPGQQNVFYLIFPGEPIGAELVFFANHVRCEKSRDESALTIERDWCPAPPMPGRVIPQPKHLHDRFGGDPITVTVNGRVHAHRLFIGGVDIQPGHRPQVAAVLNLGEHPSRWVNSGRLPAGDRAVIKGEGVQGMSRAEICEEAGWVMDHLRMDQRVLVHCAAGMNRSATICCAILMLLEGLSAEESLRRVREHHPWAKPDSHHWLALRWLEKTGKE